MVGDLFLGRGIRRFGFLDEVETGETRLLLLDEPTASLGFQQSADLLDLVDQLRDRGMGVLLDGPNRSDVKALADRGAVLRLGRNNGFFNVNTASQAETISIIVGATGNVPRRVAHREADR